MACFLVPAAEAAVMTIVTKVVASKEKEPQTVQIDNGNGEIETVRRFTLARKLRWLTNLLWGGAILLMFEHVWHGEVVPWFPFLSAAADPADAAEMLHEMATAGVTMAVLVTAVWGCMLLGAHIIEKRALENVKSSIYAWGNL